MKQSNRIMDKLKQLFRQSGFWTDVILVICLVILSRLCILSIGLLPLQGHILIVFGFLILFKAPAAFVLVCISFSLWGKRSSRELRTIVTLIASLAADWASLYMAAIVFEKYNPGFVLLEIVAFLCFVIVGATIIASLTLVFAPKK